MIGPKVTGLALVSVLVGCAPSEPDTDDSVAVYWVEVGSPEDDCADPEITSTYSDAIPINSSPQRFSTDRVTQSGAGDYALLTRSADGAVAMNLLGEVLLGETQPDGALEVSSSRFATETRTVEGAYQFLRTEEEFVERTLTLDPEAPADAPSVLTGTLVQDRSYLLELIESDEWDAPSVGRFSSSGEIVLYLELVDGGAPFNSSTSDDCDEERCEFRVFDDCARQSSVTAYRVEGADPALFTILDGYDQPAGVQP